MAAQLKASHRCTEMDTCEMDIVLFWNLKEKFKKSLTAMTISKLFPQGSVRFNCFVSTQQKPKLSIQIWRVLQDAKHTASFKSAQWSLIVGEIFRRGRKGSRL